MKLFWTAIPMLLLAWGCEVTPDNNNTTPIEVPTEWSACTAASDCVLFEAGCCDHCNGGEIVSVNATFETEAKAQLTRSCGGTVSCTQRGCAPRIPTCEAGVCGSTEDPNWGNPCFDLDQSACTSSSACRPILGALAAETCGGNHDNWMTLYGGCMPSDTGCGSAETCAINPASGERWMFPDTCTPSGWASCDCNVSNACSQGAATEAGQVCVQAGTTSGSVQFNVQAKGCFSSSCTTRHEVACSAGAPSNGTIELSSLFCLSSNADPNVGCTADCGGGGNASCSASGLADGAYTAKLGDIELSFTMPLTDSVCAGDPFGP